MLGRFPDNEVARRIGAGYGTVRLKRLALGIASASRRERRLTCPQCGAAFVASLHQKAGHSCCSEACFAQRRRERRAANARRQRLRLLGKKLEDRL
jgi:hypothetical protein